MKKVIVSLIAVISMVVGVWTQPVQAEGTICDDIDADMRELAGCTNDPNKTVDRVANKVLETVSAVIAIVAVFVMIYGGYTYLTSTGDAGKIQRAKNILIYGVVGLVVSVMAYAIVKFVGEAIGK